MAKHKPAAEEVVEQTAPPSADTVSPDPPPSTPPPAAAGDESGCRRLMVPAAGLPPVEPGTVEQLYGFATVADERGNRVAEVPGWAVAGMLESGRMVPAPEDGTDA